MANENDVPAISLPNESTQVDIKSVNKAAGKPVPPPPKRPATEQLKAQRPAPLAKAPAAPAKAAAPAPRRPASEAVKAQPPAAAAPRRPASEAVKAPPAVQAPRRPASEAVKAQPPAPAPVAKPVPAPVVAQELSNEDDDPETLLRKYSERQKTKISRLEQQLGEYKRVVAERDDLRGKAASLSKELESAKRQIEAAAKSDEVIKDLQSRVDAAILSNTMLTDENGKLKKAVQDLQANSRKFEEKAATADKASVEAQKALASQTEARKQAEARIGAALQALQGDGAARRAPAPAPAPAPPRRK